VLLLRLLLLLMLRLLLLPLLLLRLLRLLSLLFLLWLCLDDRPLLLLSLDCPRLSLIARLQSGRDAAQLLLQGLGLCVQLLPPLTDLQ